MKKTAFVLLSLLVCQLAQANNHTSSFIFPVLSDNATSILSNTTDPCAAGGGWYVKNGFGTNWNETFDEPKSQAFGGVTHPYHPGLDYNRYDGRENTGNSEPVYSIADGVLIRAVETSAGWSVIIKYLFPVDNQPVNLSQYVLVGTTPTSVIQSATGVTAYYQHLINLNTVIISAVQQDNTVSGYEKNDYRPHLAEQNVIISQEEIIGYINSQYGHLHFEIRAYNSSVDYALASATAYLDGDYYGYYSILQIITNNHHINPSDFIKIYGRVGFFSDNWHSDGSSQAVLESRKRGQEPFSRNF